MPEQSWPMLKLLTYRVELKSKSASTLAGGMPFELELSSRAQLIPLERSGERVALLLRLREPKVTFGGKSLEDGTALARELEQPFWFALERGKIVETRVSEGLSGQAVSLLRTLTSALQLSPPASAADVTKPWTAREPDATGEYEASYALGSGGVIKRTKQRYLDTLISGKVNAEQRKAVLPRVVKAETTLALSDGLLREVSSHEQVSTTLLGKETVTVTTDFSLVRDAVAPSQPDPAMVKLSGKIIPLLPSQAYGVVDARAAFDALRAQDATFPEVLKNLERVAQDPGKRAFVGAVNDQKVDPALQDQAKQQVSELTSELGKLTGLIRVEPKTIAQVEAALASHSPASSLLLDGLSSAGTDPAQRSLATLLRGGTLSRELRLAAATSLIRVQQASPATVELLTSLTSDPVLRDHAVYGLGTAARRLTEHGQAPRSQPIVATLIAGLQAAKSTDDKVRWLRGIANSAASEAFSAVLPFIEHKESVLRETAIEAIRLMPEPKVDGIFAERLQKEEQASIRVTIVRAMDKRSPNDALERALQVVATSDAEKSVRSAARRLLETWAKQRPTAQAMLVALPVDKP
jgi:hypothetical protein